MSEISSGRLGRTAVRWAPAVALAGSSALFAVLSAHAIPADIAILGRAPRVAQPAATATGHAERSRPVLVVRSEPREAAPRRAAAMPAPLPEIVTAPAPRSAPGYFVPEGEADDSVPVEPAKVSPRN